MCMLTRSSFSLSLTIATTAAAAVGGTAAGLSAAALANAATAAAAAPAQHAEAGPPLSAPWPRTAHPPRTDSATR